MNNDLSLVDLLQHIDKQVFETSVIQKEQFQLFFNLLNEWNVKINLISRNEKNVVDRHFLNSVSIAHFVKIKPGDRVSDLGSGGGFPGIVLKILYPDSSFLLIDSVRKKTDFLKCVVDELKLQKIDILNERIEKISSSKQYAASFDYVTARALAPLKELVRLSRPFLKKNGKMVFLKGRRYNEEIQTAAIDTGKIGIHVLRSISESQDGALLVIKAD